MIPRETNIPYKYILLCSTFYTGVSDPNQVSLHSERFATWAGSPAQDCSFVFGHGAGKALYIES